MSEFNLRCRRAAAVLALAAVATAPFAPASAQTHSSATVAPHAANPPVVFAQTRSDLPVDPRARFGRLPNGMGFVIYKNRTPPGAASVWMRIDAGSVMEQEDQRGLAHFVEHMAFKGSEHVPEGEMVKLLERDGLQFGADTNAQTSHFETVYMLNLPDASPRVVGDALFLMRETAGNLTFGPAAIDSERGVILGEERARSTVESRAVEAQMKTLLAGTKFERRMPIGQVDVIKTAQRPAFVQFYNDFYRPEYTTLIVVGDVDADRVEADIRKRFADWHPGPQSAAALTDFGAIVPRSAPTAGAITADGLTETLSVSWPAAPADAVETRAVYRERELFRIASAILNERLARAAVAEGSAFTAASFQREDIKRTARIHSLGIEPKGLQHRAALAQAMGIVREFFAHGPTQGELDELVLQETQRNRDGAARSRTIASRDIAALIVEALGSQGVVQSPSQGRAEFEAIRPALTLAALRDWLAHVDLGAAPLVWRQGSQPTAFDEAATLAAYGEVMAAPLRQFAGRDAVAWPYTGFGTPSAVVSKQAQPGVGATRVGFANGVRLTFKQTRFEDNAVHVSVQLGNGYLGIRPHQGAVLFMAKQVGLYDGGLGKLPATDLGQALAGKVVGLGFTIANNAAVLSGTTIRADLPTQMQVLAAFVTDPAFRGDALERVKASLPAVYESSRTSPDGVYSLRASAALYGDDPRFAAPPIEEAMAVGNDAVAALLKDQLGHGPVDVTIVGDLDLEEAVAQVQATFGALPPLPVAQIDAQAAQVRFPAGELRRTYTHTGRSDQNLSLIAWPTGDHYADPHRVAVLHLLSAVLRLRELEEVRGRQGATYSVSATSVMSRHFAGFGFISSRATVLPEVDDAYVATVASIADDLKRRPIGRDEMLRARRPIIDNLRSAKNGNGYWMGLLSGTLRDPRRIASAAIEERELLSVTREDIRRAAREYLDMSKALRIQIRPESVVSTDAK